MDAMHIARRLAKNYHPDQVLCRSEVAEEARDRFGVGFHESWDVADLVAALHGG